MTETIEVKIRKARKQHICDYCEKPIEKGTLYEWSKNIFDGEFFEWRSHLACAHIASAIWDYVEPDEGMHSDEFHDGCQEVCQSFICPDCPKWDAEEYEGCTDDKSYCLDKMEQFFGTHELYIAKRDGYAHIWKVRKKDGTDCQNQGIQRGI